jgi:AcrR family transcriptional regulator
VRIADIARRAGVSRAWIYKYLGGEPAALIAFAVHTYAEAFGAPVAGPLDAIERLRAGTRKGLDDARLAPWCVLVFFRFRHAKGPLGDTIRAALRAQAEELAGRLPPPHRGDLAVATLFEAARLALYHEWLDPEVRAVVDADRAVDHLLALLGATTQKAVPELRHGLAGAPEDREAAGSAAAGTEGGERPGAAAAGRPP